MATQHADNTILALTPGLMLVPPSCANTPERTTDWTSSYENSDDQMRKGVEHAPKKTLALPCNMIASPLRGSTTRTTEEDDIVDLFPFADLQSQGNAERRIERSNHDQARDGIQKAQRVHGTRQRALQSRA